MQDDPNFPAWAQRVVLFFVGAVFLAAIIIGGGALWGIASWINSGSH